MDDKAVATVTDGVLQGVTNGATLNCTIVALNDQDSVAVEISPAAYLYQTWDGWSFKGAGAKSIAINEVTGGITFTYSSNRVPYSQMS